MPGGFDSQGNLSTDPGAILAADRALPIGYWKGSGLALLLDLAAALLAGGLTTHEIGQQETEYGVSQVFIAFDVTRAGGAALVHRAVEEAIADLHAAIPVEEGDTVLYPGERALHTRAEKSGEGDSGGAAIWQSVLEM
ncbi:MAG: Ldh family oxidoreductase [Caldilineaceae bacterium]